MKRYKPKVKLDAIDRLRMETLVNEVVRVTMIHRGESRNDESFRQLLRWDLERLFFEANDRLEILENQTDLGLHPDKERKGFGFTASMANVFRARNISSRPGMGFECDVCSECDVRTAGILQLGNYKARVQLDMCRKCLERLAAVVDARLEDRRIRDNRHRKAKDSE